MRLLLINAAVLAGIAITTVIGLEAYLRLTVPATSSESIYVYTLDDKRYKLMKANAAVSAWGKELRTNELGFRDSDATVPAKQPGEFRIVVLGASFTVGAGVAYEDIYTSVLERRLRETHPRVSVVNLAVGGYNLIQSALVLQQVGLALKPDLVVVGITPQADFGLDAYETNKRVAAGEAPAVPPTPWYKSLYAYRAYGSRIEARLIRTFQGKTSGQASPGWEQNAAALKTVVATARERGIPVRAVLLPETWSLENQRASFARVQAECTKLELPCLALLEPFIARGVPGTALRLNALDAHPNERWHALVGDALAADVVDLLSKQRL